VSPVAADGVASLRERLRAAGYAFVPADAMRALLHRYGALSDWSRFAASWSDLGLDNYMADHGRYRRRRHAVYALDPEARIERLPHQPHYQGLQYNALNGGVARWFQPIDEALGAGESMSTLLHFAHGLFAGLLPAVARWFVEAHQFRIEARGDELGQPTPEGLHRDGVDYVLVLLIARHNIASGTTSTHDLQRQPLGEFTLTHPLDAALVDDGRVYHGVTAVSAVDPAQPAYRDVLVLTFKRWVAGQASDAAPLR
jgi:hypothetical protein